MSTPPQPSLVGTPSPAPTVTPAIGAQTTVPEVVGAANPATATAAPAVNPSAAAPTDVYSLIDGAVSQNPLNKYFNYTYHFRLFMMKDGDPIAQTGTTNPSMISANLSTLPQVTIAESGVTGYNIKEVQMVTQNPGSDIGRQSTVSSFELTIVEPSGVSFLDALMEAGYSLNLRNYSKSIYYLELYFVGYDENGKFASSLSDSAMPNGGRWVWAIEMNRITTKLNEGGAVYTVLAAPSGMSVLLTDNTDVLHFPEPIHAVGNTVGDLLDNYIDNLNIAWHRRYGGQIVKFEKIVFSPVGSTLLHPVAAADKNPRTFTLKPPDPDRNPARHLDNTGTYTASTGTGYSIPDFIVDVIKTSVEGQNLAKDDDNVRRAPDQAGAAVNDRKHRESLTWNVEAVSVPALYDPTTRNYVRSITFYVTPRATPVAITQADVEDAKDPQVQLDRVKELVENGLLRRRYDYLFTGLNTEVITLDITWEMAGSLVQPAYSGANMGYDVFRVGAKLAKHNTSPDGTLETVTHAEDTNPIQFDASIGPTVANAARLNNPSLTAATTATPTVAGAVGPTRAAAAANTEVMNSNNVYIEDELHNLVHASEDFSMPPAFWQGALDVEHETGNANLVGQPSRDRSLTAAIFSQANNLTKNSSFLRANMTIRGDPFWLGQSNLHRQVLLQTLNLSESLTPLPSVANPQNIFLFFRYPLMTLDNFKPALKTSRICNGIYTVTGVVHHFVDGEFRTEFTDLQRQPLLDEKFWTGDPFALNGGSGSAASAGGSSPSSSSRVGVTAPGASPSFTPGKPGFIAAFTPIAQQISAQTGIAPELILAQAGLESNWGKSAPQNNFFGIKGGGLPLQTQEVINCQTQTVTQNFAAYLSPADSFAAYGNLMNTARYAGVRNASGIAAQAQALQAAGYATDQNYATKLINTAAGIHLNTTTTS